VAAYNHVNGRDCSVFATTVTLVILSLCMSVTITKLVSILVGFAVNFDMSHFVVFSLRVPIGSISLTIDGFPQH
jgi:hypothetical protein